MTELLVVIVTSLVVIAAATLVGPRLRIAAPLVLVAIGVAASFLPVFGSVHIEPEWIIEGVLPPLLYSSAVSMPSMNFRREFGAISGLSVVLVVGTALLLGLFFSLVVPGLGFAWGVALGAIVSPTAIVATAASFSFWGSVGTFAYSVVVAFVIGRIRDARRTGSGSGSSAAGRPAGSVRGRKGS